MSTHGPVRVSFPCTQKDYEAAQRDLMKATTPSSKGRQTQFELENWREVLDSGIPSAPSISTQIKREPQVTHFPFEAPHKGQFFLYDERPRYASDLTDRSLAEEARHTFGYNYKNQYDPFSVNRQNGIPPQQKSVPLSSDPRPPKSCNKIIMAVVAIIVMIIGLTVGSELKGYRVIKSDGNATGEKIQVVKYNNLTTGEGAMTDNLRQIPNMFKLYIREDIQDGSFERQCAEEAKYVDWLNQYTGAKDTRDLKVMRETGPCGNKGEILYNRNADGITMADGDASSYEARLEEMNGVNQMLAKEEFEKCAQQFRINYEQKCSKRAVEQRDYFKKASLEQLIEDSDDLKKVVDAMFCGEVVANIGDWDRCPLIEQTKLSPLTKQRFIDAKHYAEKRYPISTRARDCAKLMEETFPTSWGTLQNYQSAKSAQWITVINKLMRKFQQHEVKECVYVR